MWQHTKTSNTATLNVWCTSITCVLPDAAVSSPEITEITSSILMHIVCAQYTSVQLDQQFPTHCQTRPDRSRLETTATKSGNDWTDLVWLPFQPTEDSDNRSLVVGWWERYTQCGLGAWVALDSELTLQRHVNKVASVCFYYIRRFKQVHWLLGLDVASTLVSAFVLRRLDYCNAILASLPKSTTAPLQRAQNAAAKLVT